MYCETRSTKMAYLCLFTTIIDVDQSSVSSITSRPSTHSYVVHKVIDFSRYRLNRVKTEKKTLDGHKMFSNLPTAGRSRRTIE